MKKEKKHFFSFSVLAVRLFLLSCLIILSAQDAISADENLCANSLCLFSLFWLLLSPKQHHRWMPHRGRLKPGDMGSLQGDTGNHGRLVCGPRLLNWASSSVEESLGLLPARFLGPSPVPCRGFLGKCLSLSTQVPVAAWPVEAPLGTHRQSGLRSGSWSPSNWMQSFATTGCSNRF